jgi:hypothetical protein
MRVCSIGLSAGLAAMLVAISTDAVALNCEVPAGIDAERPGEEATEVGVRVVLVSLYAIRETEESFAGDLIVVGTWRDPRLAADALGHSLEGCRFDPDQFWNPRAQVLNLRKVEVPMSQIEVDRKGGVVRRSRMIGEFGFSMDLRDYPFDQQTLAITVVSPYGPEEVVFQVDDNDLVSLTDDDLAGWLRIPGSARVTVTPQPIPGRERAAAGVTVTVSMIRERGFHLWKLILPLSLIVFMAWGVFWIDPSNLGPQVSLSTGAAFTFVAFQLGLSDLLPPIDYLTRADRFVIGSQLLVFLALAEAITAAHLFASGREAFARNLDWWSRVIYPAGFLLVLCLSFWV